MMEPSRTYSPPVYCVNQRGRKTSKYIEKLILILSAKYRENQYIYQCYHAPLKVSDPGVSVTACLSCLSWRRALAYLGLAACGGGARHRAGAIMNGLAG
jgi:hypothetical protein